MEATVVIPAQKTEIACLRCATVRPGHDVVDIAPPRRPAAAGSDTVTVSGNHRATQRSRDHPGPTTNIQDLRSRTEDDSGDRRIAAELTDGERIQHEAVLGLVETTRPPA